MMSILINLKNLFPYLLFICVYFFFVNIEAQKNHIKDTNNIVKKNFSNRKDQSNNNNSNFRIRIPIVPYNKWAFGIN